MGELVQDLVLGSVAGLAVRAARQLVFPDRVAAQVATLQRIVDRQAETISRLEIQVGQLQGAQSSALLTASPPALEIGPGAPPHVRKRVGDPIAALEQTTKRRRSSLSTSEASDWGVTGTSSSEDSQSEPEVEERDAIGTGGDEGNTEDARNPEDDSATDNSSEDDSSEDGSSAGGSATDDSAADDSSEDGSAEDDSTEDGSAADGVLEENPLQEASASEEGSPQGGSSALRSFEQEPEEEDASREGDDISEVGESAREASQEEDAAVENAATEGRIDRNTTEEAMCEEGPDKVMASDEAMKLPDIVMSPNASGCSQKESEGANEKDPDKHPKRTSSDSGSVLVSSKNHRDGHCNGSSRRSGGDDEAEVQGVGSSKADIQHATHSKSRASSALPQLISGHLRQMPDQKDNVTNNGVVGRSSTQEVAEDLISAPTGPTKLTAGYWFTDVQPAKCRTAASAKIRSVAERRAKRTLGPSPTIAKSRHKSFVGRLREWVSGLNLFKTAHQKSELGLDIESQSTPEQKEALLELPAPISDEAEEWQGGGALPGPNTQEGAAGRTEDGDRTRLEEAAMTALGDKSLMANLDVLVDRALAGCAQVAAMVNDKGSTEIRKHPLLKIPFIFPNNKDASGSTNEQLTTPPGGLAIIAPPKGLRMEAIDLKEKLDNVLLALTPSKGEASPAMPLARDASGLPVSASRPEMPALQLPAKLELQEGFALPPNKEPHIAGDNMSPSSSNLDLPGPGLDLACRRSQTPETPPAAPETVQVVCGAVGGSSSPNPALAADSSLSQPSSSQVSSGPPCDSSNGGSLFPPPDYSGVSPGVSYARCPYADTEEPDFPREPEIDSPESTFQDAEGGHTNVQLSPLPADFNPFADRASDPFQGVVPFTCSAYPENQQGPVNSLPKRGGIHRGLPSSRSSSPTGGSDSKSDSQNDKDQASSPQEAVRQYLSPSDNMPDPVWEPRRCAQMPQKGTPSPAREETVRKGKDCKVPSQPRHSNEGAVEGGCVVDQPEHSRLPPHTEDGGKAAECMHKLTNMRKSFRRANPHKSNSRSAKRSDTHTSSDSLEDAGVLAKQCRLVGNGQTKEILEEPGETSKVAAQTHRPGSGPKADASPWATVPGQPNVAAAEIEGMHPLIAAQLGLLSPPAAPVPSTEAVLEGTLPPETLAQAPLHSTGGFTYTFGKPWGLGRTYDQIAIRNECATLQSDAAIPTAGTSSLNGSQRFPRNHGCHSRWNGSMRRCSRQGRKEPGPDFATIQNPVSGRRKARNWWGKQCRKTRLCKRGASGCLPEHTVTAATANADIQAPGQSSGEIKTANTSNVTGTPKRDKRAESPPPELTDDAVPQSETSSDSFQREATPSPFPEHQERPQRSRLHRGITFHSDWNGLADSIAKIIGPAEQAVSALTSSLGTWGMEAVNDPAEHVRRNMGIFAEVNTLSSDDLNGFATKFGGKHVDEFSTGGPPEEPNSPGVNEVVDDVVDLCGDDL